MVMKTIDMSRIRQVPVPENISGPSSPITVRKKRKKKVLSLQN
tara:strand:- start:832 stop:960 length:129 start_codon:yes stop_codon:yes gene_type:complete